MDYRGQKLSENIYYFLTILCGAIGWIIGFVNKDFWLTFYGWAVGLVLALLICIPDWPIFNRNPVVWLEKIGQKNKTVPATPAPSTNTTSKTGSSKKNKKEKNHS